MAFRYICRKCSTDLTFDDDVPLNTAVKCPVCFRSSRLTEDKRIYDNPFPLGGLREGLLLAQQPRRVPQTPTVPAPPPRIDRPNLILCLITDPLRVPHLVLTLASIGVGWLFYERVADEAVIFLASTLLCLLFGRALMIQTPMGERLPISAILWAGSALLLSGTLIIGPFVVVGDKEYAWALQTLERHQHEIDRKFGGARSVSEHLDRLSHDPKGRRRVAIDHAKLIDDAKRSGQYAEYCRDTALLWRSFH